jgi:hypothetical protein
MRTNDVIRLMHDAETGSCKTGHYAPGADRGLYMRGSFAQFSQRDASLVGESIVS